MDEDKSNSQTQDEEQVEDVTTDATQDDSQENDEVQDDSQDDSSEDDSTDDDSSDDDSQEEEETEEAPPSPRQNKAIERLTKKLAEAQAGQSQPLTQTQKKQIIAEGDYDIEQINGMAQQYGEEQYSAGLQKAEAMQFQTRLEIDGPRVASKYPVLDQDSDKFNPGIADFINRQYLATVGYDPKTGGVKNNSVRYEEYADGMMELVETLATAKAADSSNNVRKQAARTGVRPSNVSKKSYSGSDPRKMSNKQLEQQINDMLGIKPR